MNDPLARHVLRARQRAGGARLGLLTLWLAVTIVACTSRAADSGSRAAGTVNPAAWPVDGLTIANLGHSTLLMNYLGVRVISDPALFQRVGFSLDSIFTIGPRRLVEPPLKPGQLKPLDVILITHAHMDHLDLPSLKALPKSAVVVACSGCADLIRPLGYTDVRELKWGDRTEIKGLTISAMGANHWGRRWPPLGRAYGFNSYLLAKGGRRTLLACDSAFTDLFASLGRDNPPAVAVFSIGAYDPWIRNHADPGQVWTMFRQTGATYLVPVHWGTFRLSKEPMDEPMRRLLAAAGPEGKRVVLRRIGESWTMPSDFGKRASTNQSRASR
jgi:L-ascorbate metabolism protein UlaG (beta-lactamase superfamily)